MKYIGWHFACVFVGLAFIVASGCGSPVATAPTLSAPVTADAPLNVMVSIVPQAYFVERIAGALAKVDVLAPPNHTAETHQVTPRQMDALSRADAYFRIGMPFEAPLVQRLTATFPGLKIVDTRQGVLLLGAVCDHDHDDHHHHEEGDDPHIWLDPMRVKIQAKTIASALSALAPDHAPVFMENLRAFEADLEALHQRIEAQLAPLENRVFYVYHPAFAYFADAYGFEQRAIEHEGKSPGSRRLYALIEEIKEAGVRAIFDQPQFADGSVRVIAESVGIEVIVLNDLMADYIEGMEQLALALVAGLA